MNVFYHGIPYFEFSKTPRIANLKGSTVAKKQVDNERENIKDDDNLHCIKPSENLCTFCETSENS